MPTEAASGHLLRLCFKVLHQHGSSQRKRFSATTSQPQLFPRTIAQNCGPEPVKTRSHPWHLPEVQADFSACASFLRSCGNGQLLSDGKLVHEHLIKSGMERKVLWGNLLVQMYGSCGAMEDATRVFDTMFSRDRFSWNSVIRVYAQQGKEDEVFRPFEQMLQEAIMPDKYIIVGILSACSTQGAFAEGKQIHARVGDGLLQSDLELGNAIVNMYSKCGFLEGARGMFDKMCERDTVTWTVMIAAYAHLGQSEEALRLFERMDNEGVKGDKMTFTTILSACINPAALLYGRRIHKLISNSELESDVVVGNALLNMYSKCGSLQSAEGVFLSMITRNEITWTAMITAYSQHGSGKAALKLFYHMLHGVVQPNKVTYISIFSACGSISALIEGKRLHSSIANSGLESDVGVGTALVTMYGRCGDLEEARNVFDNILQHNICSWNAMLGAYGQHGQVKDALQLFGQMLQHGAVPDKITYISMISALTSKMNLDEGKAMHARIVGSSFESNLAVANVLIDMYGKCGSPEDAWINFERMHERDKISFVSILSACASQADLTKGKKIHNHIVACGLLSDTGLAHALVNMYCKCGSIKDAWRVFEVTQDRDRNVWSTMIAAHGQLGQEKEALQLFDQMQKEGILPDNVAFIAALSACATQGALVEGKWIHSRVAGSILETDVALGNSLLDMYSKCGTVLDARWVFDETLQRDSILWTSMIAAFIKHGQGQDAFNLFRDMQKEGFMPDRATFISVLPACVNQAAVEGKWLHACVVGCGVGSDVFVGTALVNMYGKHGNLEDAMRTFEHMPEHTIFTWNSMMTVYAQHGQANLALQAYVQMQKKGVKPDNATFVSVFSACSHTGLVEEGCSLFASMTRYYCIIPLLDHYNCIIDLLGRAGQLNMVADLVINMPFQPSFVSWWTFLNSCRIHFDLEQGEKSTKHLNELYVGKAIV